MTRPLHPADALELSLAGIVTADGADDLLAVVASLRAASGAIAAPPGLRARRGALLARAAPPLASRQPLSLSRRLQATLMAATLAVVGGVSFVGASIGISWLRDVMPAAPAPYGSPGSVESDRTETPSPPPAPTIVSTPDLHGVIEPDAVDAADSRAQWAAIDASDEPARRIAAEMETDEPEAEESPDGDSDEEEDWTGADADDPEAEQLPEADELED